MVPTSLGISLVSGYKDIDPELISATLRANIEKNMDLIAKGQANFDSVLDSVLGIFKQKFVYFKDNIAKMELFFGSVFGTFEEALATATPFSQCGKCHGMMKLVKDFSKIHCENCKLTLNLPRDAEYSLTEGGERKHCPMDNFEIINYYILRDNLETK
jgi:DNA topoisomerase-3